MPKGATMNEQREIKFRCWCMNKKEWEKDIILLTPNGGICQLKNEVHIPCRSDTHIIQLFTGLKDKNGKEIYEGDIVKFDNDGEVSIHSVEWQGDLDYPAFDLVPNPDIEANALAEGVCCPDNSIEVIGNIYENKELLK